MAAFSSAGSDCDPDRSSGNSVLSLIEERKVDLIINTPLGQQAHADQAAMYAAAVRCGVPLVTTLSAAQAAVAGIRALRNWELKVRNLQAHHAKEHGDEHSDGDHEGCTTAMTHDTVYQLRGTGAVIQS